MSNKLSSSLQQCRHYKNRWRFSKVMITNVLPPFYRSQCTSCSFERLCWISLQLAWPLLATVTPSLIAARINHLHSLEASELPVRMMLVGRDKCTAINSTSSWLFNAIPRRDLIDPVSPLGGWQVARALQLITADATPVSTTPTHVVYSLHVHWPPSWGFILGSSDPADDLHRGAGQ